jgi:hypothetical protein
MAALSDNEICRLASSFHDGDGCSILQPRRRGSFNLCFCVEFQSPSEQWVVRIPIPATLPNKAMMDEKTEIELATMR